MIYKKIINADVHADDVINLSIVITGFIWNPNIFLIISEVL